MTAQTLTYVAVWPVLDRTRPVGALIAEAARDLDVMVQLAGGRIPSRVHPQWDISLTFDRLVCHVPVQPYNAAGEPVGRVTPLVRAQIERMAANGMTTDVIAEACAVSPTTVRRHITKMFGPRRA